MKQTSPRNKLPKQLTGIALSHLRGRFCQIRRGERVKVILMDPKHYLVERAQWVGLTDICNKMGGVPVEHIQLDK